MTLPRISIITPSYNQAAFIEANIQSVLNQNYPNIEHIVIDGGSDDGTIDILKKYKHLTWVSEKDEGQADALNKGLAMASGTIVGWLNSDDFYEPQIFETVEAYFRDDTTHWLIGNLKQIHLETQVTIYQQSQPVSHSSLLKNPDIVRQQCTFFRKALLEQVNGWDSNYFMVMDFDLWVRLSRLSTPKMINLCLANFLLHPAQKTQVGNIMRQTREILSILDREKAPFRLRLSLVFRKYKSYCKQKLKSLLKRAQ